MRCCNEVVPTNFAMERECFENTYPVLSFQEFNFPGPCDNVQHRRLYVFSSPLICFLLSKENQPFSAEFIFKFLGNMHSGVLVPLPGIKVSLSQVVVRTDVHVRSTGMSVLYMYVDVKP